MGLLMENSHNKVGRRQTAARSRYGLSFPVPASSVASVSVLMLAGVLHCSAVSAQTVPRVPRLAVPPGPVPSGTGSSLPSGSSGVLATGSSSANPVYAPTVAAGQFAPYVVDQVNNIATITETSNNGILNWNTFNIGGAATVNIVQPSTTSSLLNVVNGPLSQSLINGVLTAKGIVYLYNPAGIIFGKSATVDVNTLFASTLQITNATYLQGILSPSLFAPFAADATLGATPGSIEVDGQLNAASGGKIMLFAPNVTNNGIVTAPDGQVIMAGGGKVYLSAPTSTAMRGLYVEVDSSSLPANSTSVTNNGAISVGRGNATLAGLAVNQNGSITAQTSVSLNGSIYLQATDGASKSGATTAAVATTTGTVTLGSGSVTKISIVDDGNTITQGPTDTPYNPSQVTLTGQTINVQNNAQILATGGNVAMNASMNVGWTGADVSAVNLAPGSKIDVSGDSSAVLPMSSNVISVQLLAELADNIVLRDSTLRGSTLNFDIRTGTSIANISADLAKIPYTIGQLAATGGSVNLSAGASVVQQAGSTIDVSGGQVSYTAGYVNTSKLVSGGALFSDATAPMNRTYSGFVNLPDGRWDYQPAYTNGMSAGSVTLGAPDIVLQGLLKGTVVTGQYQRNVTASNYPHGGQLIIGGPPTPGFEGSAAAYGLVNQIVLDSGSVAPVTNVAAALASNRLDLYVDAPNSIAGFTSLTAYTGGSIDVPGNLSFGAGSTVSLTALGPITLNGGITMPGGSLKVKSQDAVTLAAGTNVNLAGTWVNDSASAYPALDANGNPVGNIIPNGGNLSINGAQLVLNPNVAIDVSGGAWFSNTKALTYGTGGNITLSVNPNAVNPNGLQKTVSIGTGVKLDSYGFTKGGSLSIETDSVQIGGNPGGSAFWLPANYFDLGGFSSFSINALSNLTVEPGTQITAEAQNWMFANINQWHNVSSGTINSVASPATLNLVGPQSGRQPVNISLSAAENNGNGVTGTLVFGSAASLTTDPNATVTLTAGNLLNFDGMINAPAGTINLNLSSIDPGAVAYDPTRSIWIGPEAHLFAQGSSAMLYTQPNGITTGQLLGGGAINIGGTTALSGTSTDVGYVVVQQQSAQGQQGGATFDVSGTAAAGVVLAGTRSTSAQSSLASAGGGITIDGREGIFFSGTAKGSAGNATQQGGTFNMLLVRGQQNESSTGYPDGNLSTLRILDGPITSVLPAGLTAGQSIVGFGDQGWISTGSFATGGFDRLYFKSQDAIDLSSSKGSFSLNAKASIYLDAPILQVDSAAGSATPLSTVQINSAYVQLGSDDYLYQNSPTANVLANPNNNYFDPQSPYYSNAAMSGSAALTVNATTIDLVGNSVVQGVSNTNLNAVQDIRLVGKSETNLTVQPTSSTAATLQQLMPTGEFSVAGNLTLTSSQVYPVTLSSFALNAEGANSTLNFVSNGSKGYAPLSAAGALFGFAQTINQSGVVMAPFGTIDLVAGSQLNYAKGSVTSVAGTGVIPFGMLLNGREWVYDFGDGNQVAFALNPVNTTNLPETTLPQKIIISQAPNINTVTGATLDLSGGGSLYAYEFTAGSYGSVDVLKNNSTAPTSVFAILPGYTNAVAPIDYQYGQDGGLQPGSSVYLSGIAGLAAGNYVLLPAHYALLPGALAITVTSNGFNMVAANNVVNVNGSLTVAGRSEVLGAGNTVNNAVTVTPGSVVRLESQYQNYDLGTYFTSAAASAGVAVPELPADGGQLEFNASNSLALAGQFLLGPAKNGRNGIADISAPIIDVVSDASQTVAADALKLVAGDLNALNADSLVLGGTRRITGGTANLSVGAQSITIENNSSTPLTGTEIILAAQNSVTLAAGSVVAATGTMQHAPASLVIQNTDPDGAVVGTDGALLRVSAGAAVSVQRHAPPGATGTLQIAQGAVVSATGSAYLDATLSNVNHGQLNLPVGAALGVAAPRISLGDAIPAGTVGLLFNSAALSNLNSLAALQLSSYSTIDLYGNVNLGSSAMKDLTLSSAGFQGNYAAGAAGNVTLTAQNIELDGGSNFAPLGPVNAGSAGSFNVTATKNITVGNGNVSIKGYGETNLSAAGQISAAGSGTLSVDQNLTLAAAMITAESGSVVTVAAGNNLTLSQAAGNSSTGPGNAPMGGNVAFTAHNTITSNANINLPSGTISMTGDNGVAITGGTIYAGGASEVFGSTTSYAPGGAITLNAGNGNLNVGPGSLLDVSATGASAGLLSVAATGSTSTITLNGTVKGSALPGVDGAARTQGSFSMDAGQMTSATELDQIATTLSSAGFNQQQNYRLRNGDLSLDSGVILRAAHVNLATDSGNISIAGTIDASGRAGGSIGLYASQPLANGGSGNVSLLAGSVLNASATAAASSTTQSTAGSTGTGGTVMISTSSADGLMPGTINGGSAITFASGSSINVSGDSLETNGNANGTVTFRAPQIAGGTDVAITGLNGNVIGSKLIAVEGYKTYFTSQISEGADQSNGNGTYANLQASTSGGVIFNDALNFVTGGTAAALAARSNPALTLTVMPGIEVRSTGDLTVSVNESGQAASLDAQGWDLQSWHTALGAPVNLTLRAAGNLNIIGSLSDGFSSVYGLSMPDWNLDNQISGSFRLVGGADLRGANSLALSSPAVIAGTQSGGNVNISFPTAALGTPVALVRTGTGSIDIAAGGDVVLGTLQNADPNLVQSAQVYTAGMQAAYDGSLGVFTPPKSALNAQYGAGSTATTAAQFAEGGGSISIFATQSVTGAPEDQLVNNWLFHQGDTTLSNGSLVFLTGNAKNYGNFVANTAWWANPSYFDQGIATMAGGNVSIVALTGNLQDVSAGVATNAFMPGAAPGALLERGGGNLYVQAGGSINGGSFFVQNGQASINAGGSIGSGTLQSNGVNVNPIFALGNAQLEVTARDNLNIGAVYNPTLAAQSMFNLNVTAAKLPTSAKNPQFGTFNTYSDSSAVSFTAIAGDVLITVDGSGSNLPSAPPVATMMGLGAETIPIVNLNHLLPYDLFYSFAPPTVNVVALNGSITSGNGISMAGAARGELNLLAANSVTLTGAPLVMTDVNLASFSPYYAPIAPLNFLTTTDIGALQNISYFSTLVDHTQGGLHSGDVNPVRVIALTGDITGDNSLPNTIVLPKLAEISAGHNIQDLGFTIQNNAAGDVTTFKAGNDYVDTTEVRLSGSPVQQIIDGPGRVEVSAGHNVDLGDSAGIDTRGNLDNPYLNAGGAAINVQAGAATADYAGFVKNFVSLANLSATDQSALLLYINGITPGAVTTAQAAWTAFQNLSQAQQSVFLNSIKPDLNAIFFADLVASSKIKGLSEFDQQIATLFPTINPAGGDINVFASQLKTDQGGSISLFTPGGSVYAGLPEMPGYLVKQPADLGLFTISGGAIAALVHSNFEVDQGRVFTLGGGDISLVSQYGDLSAGAGTKTASSAPPPILTTDANGNTVVDIAGSISGSGIATLKAGPNVPDSSIYVVAPRGVFDAGDAGVRSSGSVEVNALIVLNAGNIVASGAVSGVPTVASVNIGAGLSNSATPNVNDVAKGIASAPAASAETNLSVDVLGYGSGAGSDSDCKDSKEGCAKSDDSGKKPKKS